MNGLFKMSKSTMFILIGIAAATVLGYFMRDKINAFTGGFSTWMILIPLALVVGYLIYRQKNVTPQALFNKSAGLPANWTPPQYFGAARGNALKKTPKGIIVYTRGFDGLDIPIEKEKLPARVILARIDELWAQVRADLSSDFEKRLSKAEKEAVKTLKDHYPVVYIEPSIWWDEGNGCYVGGLTPKQNTVQAVVWYRSVTNATDKKSWDPVLRWEFQNSCFLTIGRRDLAK